MELGLEQIKDRPAYTLTVGELVDLLNGALIEKRHEVKYLHNLEDLAKYLGCSVQTVYLNKRRGVFGDSVLQSGRTLLIDAEKARDAFFSEGKRYLGHKEQE